MVLIKNKFCKKNVYYHPKIKKDQFNELKVNCFNKKKQFI